MIAGSDGSASFSHPSQATSKGTNLKRKLTPAHWVLAAINAILVIGFGGRFILQLNYEFVIYVLVILLILSLIYASFDAIKYRLVTLAGLTVWSAMHLAGGGLFLTEGRLYDFMIFPLSETYPVFRYDQLVHIIGFGAATLAMHDIICPYLKQIRTGSIGITIVLLMAGLGAGAFNEIVEFIVNTVVPESGVGGYLNTSLDQCSNFIGASIAVTYLWLSKKMGTIAG